MGKANNKPQEKITKAQRTPQNLAAGERLKNMINGSPYDLKAIANLLDLRVGQVQRYLRGELAIPSDNLAILHDKCGFDLNYLLCGDEGKEYNVTMEFSKASPEKKIQMLEEYEKLQKGIILKGIQQD